MKYANGPRNIQTDAVFFEMDVVNDEMDVVFFEKDSEICQWTLLFLKSTLLITKWTVLVTIPTLWVCSGSSSVVYSFLLIEAKTFLVGFCGSFVANTIVFVSIKQW
ncbi:hypothetical protein [Flavobacterium sp.]|uniref:hypothetical protein n=1 Tax=Flavobacterium sp. TaxID=239 RepID=UPI00286E9311|nr:hypothetical protein [Flavobacterium sp.]